MEIDQFMKKVYDTKALEFPEYQSNLCRLVHSEVNLEIVSQWVRDLHDSNDEENISSLASMMEIHPLGFEKYVIWSDSWNGTRMRLHYWPQNKWPFESIHDHRFNFCSIIICGSYTHEKYDVNHLEGDKVELILTDKTLVNTGDVYFFEAGSFHRVCPSDEFTLSLIIRSKAVLPYSRVIDSDTLTLRKAYGANNKFRRKLSELTNHLSTITP